MAFVWHLSKNWRPEWGGALFWNQELSDGYLHASFNTLNLFVVSPKTYHFVTAVNDNAVEKRLTFNGWWNSNWIPTPDEPIEEFYADSLYDLTDRQANLILRMDLDMFPPERRENVKKLQDRLEALDAETKVIHKVNLGESQDDE